MKLCLRTEACVPRGNEGFGNLLMLIFSEKELFLHENITPAFRYRRKNIATYWEN